MKSSRNNRKSRNQAVEARLIVRSLMAALVEEIGVLHGEYDGRPAASCDDLNRAEGVAEIPDFARWLARLPRYSRERAEGAALFTSPNMSAALGHETADRVLQRAGLCASPKRL